MISKKERFPNITGTVKKSVKIDISNWLKNQLKTKVKKYDLLKGNSTNFTHQSVLPGDGSGAEVGILFNFMAAGPAKDKHPVL